MDSFLSKFKDISTIDTATKELSKNIRINKAIQKALDFCINAHKSQFRKSGEPYSIHPIIVATITAYFSKDKTMVIAALLHDVVEDTKCSLEDIEKEFGEDVAHIVDGLTKITQIREHKLTKTPKDEKLLGSALSFRKMLLASIDDVRVLVVKLCDRIHNMLTLDALSHKKQLRIAEETFLVYVPIAHRLGISVVKNTLEDLSFYYMYPKEYQDIDEHIRTHQQQMKLQFNHFVSKTKDILHKIGNIDGKVQIASRIKHYYSVYLKMQRKGIGIDEVLDLQAIRIIVDNKLDCYKVLGLIHIEYKPLVARFKDYVAIPKENGYQTIHTTVFYNSKIYEVQIRTQSMHNIAQYGVAAHWKYKNRDNQDINLKWLNALETDDKSNIEEFYNDAKQDLFSEEILVYSPKGELFTLPRGATAYDFAYIIHTDVGNYATLATINTIKKPLLTRLMSGDIVSIKTGNELILRCSWIDMVVTSKSKKTIRHNCMQRLSKINELVGKNILKTISSQFDNNTISNIKSKQLRNIPSKLNHLKNITKYLERKTAKTSIINWIKIKTLRFKTYTFDNIIIDSNSTINSVLFNHCCHPKFGDDIVAFKDKKVAFIHHKLCNNAYEKMKLNEDMVFTRWVAHKFYIYNMVVNLPNTRGELAKLLVYLAKLEATVLFIEYGKDKYAQNQFCKIHFEINNSDLENVQNLLKKATKVIEFYSAQDVYK